MAAKVPERGTVDSAIMQAACASAKVGVMLQHGGPFGACIVRNGIFISVAHNTVILDSDPTCHAEMNAIRYACEALKSHDLSDCELYTTCEPCPMCYGAIQWARLKKVHTGVDRFTAAEFGFDDKVFYDEMTAHSGHWAASFDENRPNVEPSMLNVTFGVSQDKIRRLLENFQINQTFRRRVGERSIGFHDEGKRFGKDPLHKMGRRRTSSRLLEVAALGEECKEDNSEEREVQKYVQVLEDAIEKAVRKGRNKEREVFAACVVKDSQVVSVGVNQVLSKNDATATAEVMAIRKAAKKLGTHVLSGCSLYATVEPDVMSLGAILWSRIDNLYFGLSQNAAARYGFEEGLMYYREFFADREIVKNVMDMQSGVAADVCGEVFRTWSEVNAVLY